MLRSASVAVALVLLASGCSAATESVRPTALAITVPPSEPSADSSVAPQQHGVQPAVAASPPVGLSIPAIDLAVPLIDLDITSDGRMEVPADYDEVGWFSGGGRPGGHGPTVIAGHVDSPTGPAVFLRLSELQPGDAVQVTDAAGREFGYTVTVVAAYPKSAFPTRNVFGAVADDELRLITCGGLFDFDAGSYVDNHVVYAARTTS